MKVTVPTELPIMGHRIKVNYQPKFKSGFKDCYGLAYADDERIEINLSFHSTEEALIKTLYHEAIHIVLDKAGLSDILNDNEEAVVKCIEANFLPLVRVDKRKWRKKIEVELKAEEGK